MMKLSNLLSTLSCKLIKIKSMRSLTVRIVILNYSKFSFRNQMSYRKENFRGKMNITKKKM
jgi:hypothetical protein